MHDDTRRTIEKPNFGAFTAKLGDMAEAFEMYQSDGRSLNVNFENDRLSEIRQGQSSGVSIRAVRNGKLGFSYSSRPDELDYVAEAAVRMAPYGKVYDYEFAGEARSEHTRPYDPRCGELNPDDLVATCTRIKDAVKDIDADAMVDCSVGGGVSRSRIVNSNGQDCREQESNFGYFVALRLAEEGNFVQNYRFETCNELVPESRILERAREAAEEFTIARKNAPLAKGKYPVLLAPSALSDILMPIAVSVNGSSIEKKTSRFVDALGEKLFDERLTIEDDPFHPQGVGGAVYDGEGVPTRRRAIIDRGTVSGFVHTLSTSKRCGHEATGNAQRGVSSLPTPGIHNLVMAGGDDEVEALMARAEGGIYLSQLLGSFTSNFLAGQVSGNISLGFLIKEGRRVGRVKNCALNVNGFDLLKTGIVGISRKREWVGNRLLPWVLVDSVQISA